MATGRPTASWWFTSRMRIWPRYFGSGEKRKTSRTFPLLRPASLPQLGGRSAGVGHRQLDLFQLSLVRLVVVVPGFGDLLDRLPRLRQVARELTGAVLAGLLDEPHFLGGRAHVGLGDLVVFVE